MANYYCMMAGLPDIELADTQPGITFEELREQCEEQLSAGDAKLVGNYLYLRLDCTNLVRLLKNPDAQIDILGNYSLEQLRDLITSATELNFNVHRYPAFMSIFAREYNYNKDIKGYFPEDEILYQFYNYAIKTCPNKFIREWIKLNLNITNILTAMLARKQGWNVADFIKGEGEVQEMIRENKTKDFDLTHEFDYVRNLVKIVDEEDPVKKEKMIDAFKWLWLDEKTFFNPFSIEAVYAYICKLEMQYRWAKLDPEKGKEAFTQIIENLRGEAKVPEEFIQK
ncbi:MAG: DUF2764 domain-containing protein [Bacteroidaceae bacterium]|nr:DUF2764 domain-containing protein [Bacteroidaceae bacterium]